jgi:hypothetical protein
LFFWLSIEIADLISWSNFLSSVVSSSQLFWVFCLSTRRFADKRNKPTTYEIGKNVKRKLAGHGVRAAAHGEIIFHRNL